jgi:hypothetical protein
LKAGKKQPKGKTETVDDSEGVVVFCIDVSGSMDQQDRLPDFQQQWKIAKGEEIVNITRIAAIKQAVATHINRLAVSCPNKKVSVITFASDILIQQDQNGSVVTSRINSMAQTIDAALERAKNMVDWERVSPIGLARDNMLNLVESIHTRGSTALGPALLASIQVAGESGLPAEIILCSDGEPNEGIGSSGSLNAETYERIGSMAVQRECKVSLIGIDGCRCAMEYLSECASRTEGNISILHPIEIVREIRKFSQDSNVAKDLIVSVLLHPHLMLGPGDCPKGLSRMVKELNSATNSTEITAEFLLRPEFVSKFNKKPEMMPSTYPFQCQIEYTDKSGARLRYVVSKQLRLSSLRKSSERKCAAAVVGQVAIQHVGKLAADKQFEESLHKLHAYRRLLERGALTDEQQEEFGMFVQRSEEFEPFLIACRQGRSSDGAVRAFYQMQRVDSSMFVSAMKKKDLCVRRLGNKELNAQYYNYKF